MPVEAICGHCGQITRKPPSVVKKARHGVVFCDMKCYRAWEESTKITVICDGCGKEFLRYKHHAQKNSTQFCSTECHGKWKSVHNVGENHPRWIEDKTLSCEQCGKEFIQSKAKQKRNRHNFCSMECTRLWVVKNGTHAGQNNSQWKPKIQVTCDNCNKPIEINPNQAVKIPHHFCDRRCKSEWMSKTFVGENSPTWKGGHPDYYGPNWRQQMRLARQRDKDTCQHCGKSKKKNGRSMDVHHIIPFRTFGYIRGQNDACLQANSLTNLICLCRNCHKQAESQHIPIQPRLLP